MIQKTTILIALLFTSLIVAQETPVSSANESTGNNGSAGWGRWLGCSGGEGEVRECGAPPWGWPFREVDLPLGREPRGWKVRV